MYFHSGDKSSAASSAIPWKKQWKRVFIRIERWKNVYQMGTNSHEISPGSGSVGAVTFWTSFIHGSVVICKDPDPSLFFSIEKTWFLSESLKPVKQRVNPQNSAPAPKRYGSGFRNTEKNYNIQYRSGKIRSSLRNSCTFICIAIQYNYFYLQLDVVLPAIEKRTGHHTGPREWGLLEMLKR